MMRPLLCLRMCGVTALQHSATPSTLISRRCFHSSAGISSKGPIFTAANIAAQLTRISMRPKAFIVSASMAAETIKAFGRIDILVNCAAMFAAVKIGPFEEIPADEWKHLLEINVLGVALCCKAVTPHMRRQRSGRIINLASGAPLKGVPYFLHYIASKGAVIAMTRGLARELGKDGITVNAIAPGLTVSDGTAGRPEHLRNHADSIRSRAIQREDRPEDLVGAVSFLAGDDCAFMTGQTLVVDGGSAML